MLLFYKNSDVPIYISGDPRLMIAPLWIRIWKRGVVSHDQLASRPHWCGAGYILYNPGDLKEKISVIATLTVFSVTIFRQSASLLQGVP